MAEPLPLFPLHAVLFPGAGLQLRVFEPRYLDMLGECGRAGTGFGVCLIAEGEETGAPATTAGFGTEALIEDFDVGPDGLLLLRVRGARRFRVLRTRVRGNGLVEADVEWRDDDPVVELQSQHVLLADVLRSVLEQIGADVSVPETRFDDAAWVGWRLAELLPMTLPQRLALLEEDDPDRRLDALLELIG